MNKFIRKDNKFVVYKIVHIDSGKMYIGITINYKKRIKTHFIYGTKNRSHLHNAIQKYGKEKFQYEIIDRCDCWNNLCQKEIKYIKLFNTKSPNGYNLTEGGDGSLGIVISGKTRKKMSESHKGKNHPNYGKRASDGSRKKMSESHKGKKNFNYGKKRDIETCKKISEANKNPSEKTLEKMRNAQRNRSKETCKKLSESHKGKKLSSKTKKLISQTQQKLSKDQVLKIKKLLLEHISQHIIAKQFNVQQMTISRINTGKGYSEI